MIFNLFYSIKIKKTDILFSFILLLNILLLVKDSQDYTFITAHNNEVIYVDGLE